jgi:hypothetical protein
VPAEREQAAVVAVVDDLEGGVVTGAHTSETSRSSPTRITRRLRAGSGDRRWTAVAAMGACATAASRCESSWRARWTSPSAPLRAPDLPGTAWGQPAGGPGRRSGAC